VVVANGSVKRRGSVWSFVVTLGPDLATGEIVQCLVDCATRPTSPEAGAEVRVAAREITCRDFSEGGVLTTVDSAGRLVR
jgi:hypothetical protein